MITEISFPVEDQLRPHGEGTENLAQNGFNNNPSHNKKFQGTVAPG